MHHRLTPVFIFLVYCLFFGLQAQANPNASHLSQALLSQTRLAINDTYKNRYEKAFALSQQTKDPHVKTLMTWLIYRNGVQKHATTSHQSILNFINSHPTLPEIKRMQSHAEFALKEDLPPKALLAYFKKYPPQTNYGKQLYIAASISKGTSVSKLMPLIQDVWQASSFASKEEQLFLSRYGHYLKAQDYVNRIDRLLWDNQIRSAELLLPKVDQAHQLMFKARIALMRDHYSAGTAIKRMPTNMLNEQGFLYERAYWHYRKKHYDNAFQYLKLASGELPYPQRWWKIKNHLIREFIDQKRYKDAYYLAYYHGMPEGSEGFAESQWLAGWISLRFLNNPKEAYKHFYNMYQHVKMPISKARASYWAGRAAEANQNPDIARDWFTVAAGYPTTFYGQLGYSKRFPNQPPIVLNFPETRRGDMDRIQSNELIIIAKILIDTQDFRLAELFINTAIGHAKTAGEAAAISSIGMFSQKDFLSVSASKEALMYDYVLTHTGYPVFSDIPKSKTGSALVHGIIRQESRFDYAARSSADAQGLMQLLPSTAKRVARDLHMHYQPAKLINDPQFNVRLGSAYIDQLYERLGNSYILALASYNGGAANVRKWVNRNGHPKEITSIDDIIDWIELIPFYETRNYVQRVLENKQVYQYIIDKKSFDLEKDLLS